MRGADLAPGTERWYSRSGFEFTLEPEPTGDYEEVVIDRALAID